jgi:hypothetical protein
VADLTPIAAKLAKCIRLLGSDRKGDIAAAFHALKRTLESAGADFNDLGNRVEQPRLDEADMQAILERGKEIGRQEVHAAGNGHGTASFSNGHGNVPSVEDMVQFCFDRVDRLAREKDRDFILDIHRRAIWRRGATPKQQSWIEDLYVQCGGSL